MPGSTLPAHEARINRKWLTRHGLPVETDLDKEPFGLYEGVEYRQFWRGVQKRKLDELEQALVADLLPAAGRRIVDVGCGYGRLAPCYLGRFREVVMVDGSMSLLRQAVEQTGGRAHYIAADVLHLPFRPAAFDAAVFVRVFHHIPDSAACLAGLHRVLCQDGRLVFSYCNKRNPARVAKWLVRRDGENPFAADTIMDHATVITHHPATVQRLLLDCGYADLRYAGAGVLDRLAGKLGSLGQWLPPGRHLAGWLGRRKLAPWIFCRAAARASADLLEADDIADLLQCPACGATVAHAGQAYVCLGCARHYPVDGGIIDLRLQ